MTNLTHEEIQAIVALKKLEKIWPKSLWLFSGSGTLYVMRKNDAGEHATTSVGGMDQTYTVATVAIENDGGDW